MTTENKNIEIFCMVDNHYKLLKSYVETDYGRNCVCSCNVEIFF